MKHAYRPALFVIIIMHTFVSQSFMDKNQLIIENLRRLRWNIKPIARMCLHPRLPMDPLWLTAEEGKGPEAVIAFTRRTFSNIKQSACYDAVSQGRKMEKELIEFTNAHLSEGFTISRDVVDHTYKYHLVHGDSQCKNENKIFPNFMITLCILIPFHFYMLGHLQAQWWPSSGFAHIYAGPTQRVIKMKLLQAIYIYW